MDNNKINSEEPNRKTEICAVMNNLTKSVECLTQLK